MPKGVETKFKLGMRRLNDKSHFVYLLKNPNLLLPVREAFIREAAHTQDAEVAEEISKRDLWKMEVVEKAKFHYNYSYPEPIVEVQSTSEKDTISRTKSRTPLPVHLYPYTSTRTPLLVHLYPYTSTRTPLLVHLYPYTSTRTPLLVHLAALSSSKAPPQMWKLV